MFEDLANPLKGKGKEKDIGKRRAYVRVVTSLGGGSLNLELFCEKASLALVYIFLTADSYYISRHLRHVIISLCSHEPENTITAYSIDWCRDSWYVFVYPFEVS
jgi:hypothetical protein